MHRLINPDEGKCSHLGKLSTALTPLASFPPTFHMQQSILILLLLHLAIPFLWEVDTEVSLPDSPRGLPVGFISGRVFWNLDSLHHDFMRH